MKSDKNEYQRLRVEILGAVQGVGFRPFVYRLATEMELGGWVKNSPQGVLIEVEGGKADLEDFLRRLQAEKPRRAFIYSLETSYLDPLAYVGFEIKRSEVSGEKTALILPDIATCDDCLNDIFNPHNRRYLYPFTNCTNCGPRFSIIEALPYDRANTTMKHFRMCPQCKAEYNDPADRRFHAQPNACPECGPHLEFRDGRGTVISSGKDALSDAIRAILAGKILAVKGLGGFHLIVDASQTQPVKELRRRKGREQKPFALMFPSLQTVKQVCEVLPAEERVLSSPSAPIILLLKNPHQKAFALSAEIAPENPYWGVMLPYTPLHHLLLRGIDRPVVATSGNLQDEPICYDEREAIGRLGGIADLFLVHNRPIARNVDDSIVRMVAGREMVLRRARGYAPLPVSIKSSPKTILAVGGHLKNTVALKIGGNVFLSQHIGDLETASANNAFQKVIADFKRLYSANPEMIICDRHPDYISTKYARQTGLPGVEVQHHYAHILSCIAENEIEGEVSGVAWDGTGYGTDGNIWGGEFLLVNEQRFERLAHFRNFPLPGGEKAIKEPRRTALGALFQIYGTKLLEMKGLPTIDAFKKRELEIILHTLEHKLNSPLTSSAGRLFDAVASLLGICHYNNFEGQGAMELEFKAHDCESERTYPYNIDTRIHLLIFDWEPMIEAIISEVKQKVNISDISKSFHNTLVEIIISLAKLANSEKVVLSGGCFQNKMLTEMTITGLRKAGFQPYWHQRVPPNDGGLALGQVLAGIRGSGN